MPHPVHLIGASGRSGIALARALLDRGAEVVPVLRDPARLPLDLRERAAQAMVADLTGPQATLRAALHGASLIVSTAHARHLPAILQASAPECAVIGLGSTRKFTRWMDEHGRGVLQGEAALMASGRAAMILHPTMIYGAQGEDNVQRLAALLRRLPIVPLPGGGRALVQPIHQDDVTRSLIAAIERIMAGAVMSPESLVIAGPHTMPYRAFVRAVGLAAGVGRRPVVSLPAGLLMRIAPLMSRLPGLPRVGVPEIRRLLEDKAFDTGPMQGRLGVTPIALEQGLAALFARA